MRFPSGQKNLLAFALVAGLGFVITLYLVPSSDSRQPTSLSPSAVEGEAGVYPSPPVTVPVTVPPTVPGGEEPATVPDDAYRGYALPLAEVRGLSPATAVGSRIQLWVSWEPPITRHPRVQRLPGTVMVEEIVEPTVPEGPTTVELLIPVDELPDFLYAHRYGSLSAVTVP